MVKTKRKDKSITKLNIFCIITGAFLVCAIVCLSIFCLYFYKRNYALQKKIDVQVANNSSFTVLNNELLMRIEELNKNLEDISDIDSKVSSTKAEFFSNAKAYEDRVLAGNGSKKIAYITIDDGPYNNTLSFLDILEKNDILATFFTLGKPDRKELYKSIVDGCHTVANHTYSHQIWNGLYDSVDSFISDVKKQEAFLYGITGQTTDIVRFPGGSPTAGNLKSAIIEKLRENGYGYVDWNVSVGDGGKNFTVQSELDNVAKYSKGRDIIVVLMHDYSGVTLEAFPLIIEQLRNDNYIFLPLFYESSTVKK